MNLIMSGTAQVLKRVVDIFTALTGLIFLSPLFLVLSGLILIKDGSPVMFRHKRIGRNKKPFMLYKFRTMSKRTGSENGLFEPGTTSRVTKTGKFLRKTKLDELPQLINVLKGEMSFVGPRPEVEKYIRYYPEKWRKILSVRPGITDMASLQFRNEEQLLSRCADPEYTYTSSILPAKLDLGIKYIETFSLVSDLKIIMYTLKYLFLK